MFKPNREEDELTRAHRNKEHPGRTRGFGLVFHGRFPSQMTSPHTEDVRGGMPKKNWSGNV